MKKAKIFMLKKDMTFLKFGEIGCYFEKLASKVSKSPTF